MVKRKRFTPQFKVVALVVEKVQELKTLADAGFFKGFDDSLAIQRAIHFAPVILAGTLLTVLCGGPFYGVIT